MQIYWEKHLRGFLLDDLCEVYNVNFLLFSKHNIKIDNDLLHSLNSVWVLNLSKEWPLIILFFILLSVCLGCKFPLFRAPWGFLLIVHTHQNFVHMLNSHNKDILSIVYKNRNVWKHHSNVFLADKAITVEIITKIND